MRLIRLDERVALITGASRGIGRGIAEMFAQHGATVYVNYSVSEAEAERVVAGIRRAGGCAKAIQADVSRPKEARRLVEQTYEDAGRLDILVNNAGIARDLPIAQMDEKAWRDVLAVNLDGTFFCSQAAAALMAGKSGKIINIAAATGLTGRRNGANYCAAKAGVIALTKCFALELAPHVQVNCLLPGFTKTDDVIRRFQLDDPDKLASQLSRIPMGRLAEVTDIAKGALFLASPLADFVTGQLLSVNGGSYM